jgi:alpha-galactosidase
LVFTVSADGPVVLSGLGCAGEATITSATQPLVELIVTGDGRARTNTRFRNTGVGSRLRYLGHTTGSEQGEERLDIVQADPLTGLRITTTFIASAAIPAARVVTSVINEGKEPRVLEAVSSFATGAVVYADESTRDLFLYSGISEQLAENRWSARALWSDTVLVEFDSAFHNQPGRGAVEAISTSTWSTARVLPTAGLENRLTGRSIAWQLEHNGGWRWEVDDVRDGEDSVAIVLLGPEDLDHHWSEELVPGARFTSVPISIAVAATGFVGAIGELTQHRRWLRRWRSADRDSLLVFNDYMNTINGDPSTERLLPLIFAAGRAGAECFCIDAGWYDDTLADWWPTVGEWIPSDRRFPGGGLARVVTAIRDAGMKVGLWLEPEVVGVRSPVAQSLPDAGFLQRHGRRVMEHDRYFLDLRQPAARTHLDATFDRLIQAFDVDYFKLDYNVTPGAGTDFHAFSVGAGLLAHNRAHLGWITDLRRRYPRIVFENCSSGAMRADFAMLELFDLQSTSDQQDFRLYPTIAAGAPVQMLPEQAGNWAYPQPWMNDEEIAFTMVTGLSGRLYLSGFLDKMAPEQLQLVSEAIALFKQIRGDTAQAVPNWPLGLPDWNAASVALTLTAPKRTLIYVWHRGGEGAEISLRLGPEVRAEHLVECYPRHLTAWEVTDTHADAVLLSPGLIGPSARVYQVLKEPDERRSA